jgi:hypothetical protein
MYKGTVGLVHRYVFSLGCINGVRMQDDCSALRTMAKTEAELGAQTNRNRVRRELKGGRGLRVAQIFE